MRNKVLFQSSKPGRTSYITHRINSSGVCHIRQYRLPEAAVTKVEEICEEMLKDGVIRPSNSHFNSPVVLVSKKDNSLRFCLNLKGVNELCSPSSYPLPTPRECFDSLGGETYYYSSCDILAAYWNIPVAEEDKHKLAFTVRSKKYEFTCCPFGLKDSSYSFVMLMNNVLGTANWKHCLAYVDDLVIFSPQDFDLHLQHLQDVFTRLIDANLRLKVAKCQFACGEIPFLGHLVGRKGLKPDPAKVKALTQIAQPETKKQVRSFLGVCGHYRNMVPNFSIVAAPLHELTKKGLKERVTWTTECQEAFVTLKKALSSYPILRLPDWTLPFEVQTDASKLGVGAVLLQERDGVKCVVAYASRLNSAAQRNYSVYDLELSAVHFALAKFKEYLWLNKGTIIRTDHSALKSLMNIKNPTNRLARWQLALADFDFEIQHLSGKANVIADALSRLKPDYSLNTD
ncbi:unnamed protein product, partial [Heterosigma akashiwo]